MADMPMGMQDQTSDQAEGEGGYTIEIEVSADGTISVNVEQAGQEAKEGAVEDEGTAKQVPDWKTALRVATDIYKNAGQIADQSQEQSGFDSVAGMQPAQGQGM